MATQQDVFHEMQNIKSAIVAKGGAISQQNANVSLPELTAGVNSIPTGGGSNSLIIAAELPGVTLNLYDAENALVSSIPTGASGGKVEFVAKHMGAYTVKALDATQAQIWAKSVTVDKIGVFDCKTGKSLNGYTWAEISAASNGGYAKYMWSVGDTKDLSSFMGLTSAEYTRAVILDFDHDDEADGSGKAGITFKLPYASSTYTHSSSSASNINGISWIGSLIRQNCLKIGESAYVYDTTVTSTTSGTYYTFNVSTQEFEPATLPGAFISGTKYYALVTAATNGAFIAGLPADLYSLIKQVQKKTWGGSGTNNGINDNTIVKTKDWLFLLSDCEVFGTQDRYTSTNSKYLIEGEQYEFYKTFKENKFRFSQSQWLRSPYPMSGVPCFAYWYSSGYVSYYFATNGYRVALCFCI